MKRIFTIAVIIAGLASCKGNKTSYDASGNFETTETIISAEANGTLKSFNVTEGDVLRAGQYIGYIDTVQLHLKKIQLESQIRSLLNRSSDIATQTGAYSKQVAVTKATLDNLLHEKKRIENLLKADAATPKQLDDINAQVDVAQKQLAVINSQEAAQESALITQNRGLAGDTGPLKVQIDQVNDQLKRSVIINPFEGTVLTSYAEENEVTATGKPLYKIADLSTMTLRAYITGSQLPAVKLNQQVKVLIDDAGGKYKEYPGVIEWISNKAEFTPKTIQTKDERANLVYAVKIRVKNDGYIKIGMYADVKF